MSDDRMSRRRQSLFHRAVEENLESENVVSSTTEDEPKSLPRTRLAKMRQRGQNNSRDQELASKAKGWIDEHYSFKLNEWISSERRVPDLDTSKISNLKVRNSKAADVRPISHVEFSPDNKVIATASWSGLCKLWSVPDLIPLAVFKTHLTRVSCFTFHPKIFQPITSNLYPHDINMENYMLASCSEGGKVMLWRTVFKDPVARFRGHEPQDVESVVFHPSGRLLGTCCKDSYWRIWDVAQQVEVQSNKGHDQAIFCMAFDPTGGLLTTGGQDSVVKLWDMRTEECEMVLEGHQGSVLAVDFSPCSIFIASGSKDNSCKVWDLRTRSFRTTLDHDDVVSGVKYVKNDGRFLVTSSFDNKARVWLNGSWDLKNTLTGHRDTVMSVDVSPDQEYIATSSFDTTIKLWTSGSRVWSINDILD